ncbi:MAG TPA: hypothetical protein VI756_29110 [Blastocatellia bacterium]
MSEWRRRPAKYGHQEPTGTDSGPIQDDELTLDRQQKQAALLRLILSDSVTDEQLDAMIEVGHLNHG